MNQQLMIFKSLQKICTGVLAIAALTVASELSASALSIGVSPPRFELKIDEKRPTTEVFRVVNIGTKPATFKLYVQSWMLDETNKIQPLPPNEQSLDKWILVNPGQFTLPPGKSQTVRFSIRPRVKPQAGEHRALIYIEEILSQENNTEKSGTPVKVVGRYGVGVYAYVGDIKKVGVVNSIEIDAKNASVKATFDVSSRGTAYVRLNGQYAIWQAAKYPGAKNTQQITQLDKAKPKLPDGMVTVGTLPSTPVLPSTRRQLILNISQQLAPGNYVLDLNGELSGVQIDKGVTFNVPAKVNTQSVGGSNQLKRSSSNLKSLLRNR
jgi:P pilus assembly chaperone PapD